MAKTKYDPDTFPLLVEGYAREGLNDKQIAAKLGIAECSYHEYVKRYPTFAESRKKGKAPVDIEVENALLAKARGYEYTEESVVNGEVVTIKRKLPPSEVAMIFWLKNRRPDRWRDRHEIEDRQGFISFAALLTIAKGGELKALPPAAIECQDNGSGTFEATGT